MIESQVFFKGEYEGLTPTFESWIKSKLYDGFVVLYTKHISLCKNQIWGDKRDVRDDDGLRYPWKYLRRYYWR